jgi:hypothetical protein
VLVPRPVRVLPFIGWMSFAAFLLALLPSASGQQVIECCPCSSKDTPLFVVKTSPSLPNACRIACASNGGAPNKGKQPWTVRHDQECGLAPPTGGAALNREASLTNARTDARYSIGHQGARVFVNSSNEMLKGDSLRKALIGPIMDIRVLRDVPIDVLEQAAAEAVTDCINEKSIDQDFVYVCRDMHQSNSIHSELAVGKFDAIRTLFSQEQKHNDKLKNLIYCRSNSQVKLLVDSYCPAPPPGELPPSKRQAPTTKKPGDGPPK